MQVYTIPRQLRIEELWKSSKIPLVTVDQLAGACAALAARAQIESTLLQFSSIKKVRISMNGVVGAGMEP